MNNTMSLRNSSDKSLAQSDGLAARIRGEFQEMPGLRLTLPQACRLWQLDRTMCETLLQGLLEEGFLVRTKDSAYLASPQRATRARMADRVLD